MAYERVSGGLDGILGSFRCVTVCFRSAVEGFVLMQWSNMEFPEAFQGVSEDF